jgi:uncharacterized tellurite resistance protein B-like protein
MMTGEVMLDRIRQFFELHLDPHAVRSDPASMTRLASAALLVELSFADHDVSPTEETALATLLRDRFRLDATELNELLTLAHEQKQSATDYFRFTSLLNRHYTQPQKIALVEDLWRLAFADGRLDKLEEHLVRRLADLLHVAHADFMQAKHRAMAGQAQQQ